MNKNKTNNACQECTAKDLAKNETREGEKTKIDFTKIIFKTIPNVYEENKKTLDNVNVAAGAISVGAGLQDELLDYAVRSDKRVNKSWHEFKDLSEKRKLAYAQKVLGKAGTKLKKRTKQVVDACYYTQTAISGMKIYDALCDRKANSKVLITKAAADILMGSAARAIGPWGWVLGTAYFMSDLTGFWDKQVEQLFNAE